MPPSCRWSFRTSTSTGRRPTDVHLARAGEEWLRVTVPDGRRGTREIHTMPQWAGSCWYYLRFLDPANATEPFSAAAERYWMPVDLYVGGVEHAVLHLLYARFWHKVLYDCGLVHTKEPFARLFNQGMVHALSYRDDGGRYHPVADVEEDDGRLFADGREVTAKLEKMSKSKLNTVNPDDVVASHGAVALRLHELFMGPLEQPKAWQQEGLEVCYRFLQRVWRLVVDERTGQVSPRLVDTPAASEPGLERSIHRTVRKVTADVEALQLNTAVSRMMVLVNEATASETLPVGP